MPQDGLDGLVINAQAVEVGSKAAAESMPAMPFRPGGVALELVVRSCMI